MNIMWKHQKKGVCSRAEFSGKNSTKMKTFFLIDSCIPVPSSEPPCTQQHHDSQPVESDKPPPLHHPKPYGEPCFLVVFVSLCVCDKEVWPFHSDRAYKGHLVHV